MGKGKILQFQLHWGQGKCESIAERFVLDVNLDESKVSLPRSQTADAATLDGGLTSLGGVPTGMLLREEVSQVADEVAETIRKLRDLLEAYAREQCSSTRFHPGR